MKKQLLLIITTVALLLFPGVHFGQAPNLGTAANFVLFSSDGAVSNTGSSHLTGNVGTNTGSSTGFGNVNGVMHDIDPESGQAATDLQLAYNELNAMIPTGFIAPIMGSGQTLNQGVYLLASASVLNNELILDGQGDPNAVFVFQIQGAFASSANARVTLLNGTVACNVFWMVEGQVDLFTGTSFKGTIVANNAAIDLAVDVELEGRALSTTGAVSIAAMYAYTPLGCGTPVLMGPLAPGLGTVGCYTIFAADNIATNFGTTNAVGDIGSNNGGVSGYDPAFVTGTVHSSPDASTLAAASDLLNTYNYLDALPHDIELLYPAQFGNQLELTPHTYLLNSAATFVDTLFLNAQGNPNAVFVIQINGALSTGTFSKVSLLNGAQAGNVFWKVEGAVSIADFSQFVGTIITNTGVMNLSNGVRLDGRALALTEAITTTSITAVMPIGCGNTSPVVVSDPVDQTICEGGSVSFSVSATGTVLNYQWRRGLVNLVDGGRFSGTNTATLTINPVGTIDDANDYNVVVTGTYAPNDVSSNASLTVQTAPSIITPPAISQSVCEGSFANFSVGATGTGLTYQWRKGNVNLVDGGIYSGATTASFTINPVNTSDAGTDYNVVISGTCIPPQTSADLTLLVNTPHTIITQPVSQTVCEGTTVNMSVVANGSGLTYQWRRGNVDLIDFGNTSGVNTSTLTLSPVSVSDAGNDYNVVVSGPCGPDQTSVDVSLVVDSPVVITTAPTDEVVCEGNPVSFSIAATGTGLTYQWRKGTVDLIDGGSISGANTTTLTINPTVAADAASDYNVVITGTCAPTQTSINVSLTVNTPQVIIIQPVDQTVCEGNSASFSVTASGSNLTYQWRRGIVSLVDDATISGANTATLTINPANSFNAANNYNVVISGPCAPDLNSNDVSLIINSLTVITNQPTDQTVCEGNPAIFSVAATGTNLTYQWRRGGVDLVDGPSISGATTSVVTIDPTALSDVAIDYNVVVTGACAPSVTSASVSLVVNSLPTIVVAPVDQTVCEGSPASFSVTATGTNLTYQWRRGIVSLIDDATISGANTATLTINPATAVYAANNYNVVITGTCAPIQTSADVSLIVNSLTAITSQPTDQSVCEGNSASFSVTTTGTNLTYRWRRGTVDLIDGGSISGVTTAVLTINPATVLDAANDYNVVVSGACPTSQTSNLVSLTVNSLPTIIVAPVDQTVCQGNSASFSVTATGTNLTYQWRRGIVSLIDDATISGANTATLTINPATVVYAANNYNVVITGTCGPIQTSADVSLTVNVPHNIVIQPTDQTVCEGSSASFSVTTTGTVSSYQWRKGTVALVNGGSNSGVNTATLTINPANSSDAATDYNVVVTGPCSATQTSANVELKVNGLPSIATQPVDQTTCNGGSVTFTVAANGTGLTYQWRRGIVALVDGARISGSNTSSVTINPVNGSDAGGNYNVVVSGTCAPIQTSVDVSLNINTAPNITGQPTSQSECDGTTASFTVVSSGSGISYKWRKGTVDLVDGGNISGVNTATLVINPVTNADVASNYNVVVSGVCAPNEVSALVSLEVKSNPFAAATSNAPVCVDSTINLFATTTAGSSVVWSGPNGYTSTLKNPSITTAKLADEGIYSVIATLNGCSSNPSNVTVEVDVCDNFFISEGFSPNNDGINDVYVIRSIENYPNNKLEIFNRWGDVVLKEAPYMNTWDGRTSMGLNVGVNELPVGTYFYVLDLGDGTPVTKGTIYLNR